MTSTDSPSRRRSPDGLRARGRKFWRASVEAFEFSDAEESLLLEACRTMDNLDLLAAAIASDGAMIIGSTGQSVVHPALTEARGQRVVLHRLIAALQLPDEDGGTVPTGGTLQRSAAGKAAWTGSKRPALREVR